MGINERIIIRKCHEEEIGLVGAFYDKIVLWLDEHINYPKWIYRVYPSEAFVREMTEAGEQYVCIDGSLDDRTDGHADNKNIIAAFVLNKDPQGNYQNGEWARDLPDGTYMVIHAMAIMPHLQRKGIGAEILRFCVETAKSAGSKALRVDVVPGNQPARQLYDKHGFLYAGDADLDRGLEHIKEFSLYELNW